MDGLTFNPKSHEYRYNGVVVPSVTQILQPLMDFSMVKPHILEAASARGTAVHKMTELYDANDLDESMLTEEMRLYLLAYKRFLDDCAFKPVLREQRLYHTMGFSGTPDLGGLVRGRMAVIDIKSMFNPGSPVIGVQLAAYKELINASGGAIVDRFALHLRRDGTYRLHPYTDIADIAVFISLFTIKKFKDHHGIA